MKFYDSREKQQVLKNCNKLKGQSVSVSNDYAKETVAVRRKLWESASAERAQGKKVFLIDDKLKINDKLYTWDNEKNARSLLNSRDKFKQRTRKAGNSHDGPDISDNSSESMAELTPS